MERDKRADSGPQGPAGAHEDAGGDEGYGGANGYDDGLTAPQHHAIMALLSEPSIAAAARHAGVGERTLHRWLREERFMGEYRRARREAFGQAIGLTQRASASAVATLLKIMHDSSAASSARVTAASQVLRFARESIEVDDLAERVEVLERGGGA